MAGSSEKTASVKLTLNGSSYIVAIKEAAKENEKAAQKSGNAWKTAGVAGLKAFGKELGGVVASVKNTISTYGKFVGMAGLAYGVKTAIDLRGEFKKLSFQIQAGSGQMVDWRELMEGSSKEAIKWGIATEEVGHAFGAMRTATGDLQFAKDSLGDVAMAARATGEPIEAMAEVAAKMHQKFGVGSKQMAEGLATAYSLANQGEIEFGEMATIIDRAGSSAKFLGVSGVDGLAKVVGMARLAAGDAKGLRAALSGTMALMEQLGSAEGAKKLGQDFGLVMKKGEGFETMMGRVLKRTGGRESVLVKGFQGEQLKIVTDYAKIYRTAFEGTSGTVEQKTKAALAAFHKVMEEAATTNLHAADLRKRAEQAALGPSAQLTSALNRMKEAFASPQFINSINKITAQLPMLSEKLGKFIELVLEHPSASLAVAAGVKLGAPALSAAISAAAPSFLKLVAPALGLGSTGSVAGGVGAGSAGTAAAAGGAGAAGVLGAAALPFAALAAFAVHQSNREDSGEEGAQKLIDDTGGTTGGKLANIRSMIDRAQNASAAAARVRKGENQYTPENKAIFDTEAIGASHKLAELKAEEARLSQQTAEKTAESFSMVDDAARQLADRLQKVLGGNSGSANFNGGLPRPSPAGPGHR